MKKMLIVMAMLAGFCVAAQAQLQNASFEMEGPEGGDRALNWDRWGDWINRETGWTPVKDGSCIIGYHHWQIEKPDDSGLYQDVKVEAGKKYAFSIYANADASTDRPNAESVELRLETTVNDQQSTLASRVFTFADLAKGSDWSKLQVEAVVPNDTLRVLIIIKPFAQGPRGGAIKLDLAELSIVP